MNTDTLTNQTIKTAIDALQKGDQKAWAALLEADAKLYDDGSPRSLEKFTKEALGHERFISIEKVENHGLEVVGGFHSDQWGDFRTYFRFHLSPSGKIKRLDIGQAA
jgi:hypothetical protein